MVLSTIMPSGSAAAVPVAVKVIAVIPDTVAVTVFVPAVEPSVSVDDALCRLEPVVTDVADSDPPPPVTANVTVTPESASPFWS